MTEQSNQFMRDACHAMAANVLQSQALTNRCKWLRETVAKLLTNDACIRQLTEDYAREYPYADAPTEYLADVLKAYDQEVE